MGKARGDELRRAEDVAVRDAVAQQEAHGMPVVTDGEYRRLNWQVIFSEFGMGPLGALRGRVLRYRIAQRAEAPVLYGARSGDRCCGQSPADRIRSQ